jgi:DNA-binding NtrC family response regulator
MSILFSGKKIDVADLPERYLLPENRTEDDDSYLTAKMPESVCSASSASFFLEQNTLETTDAEIDFKEMIHQYEVKLIAGALRAAGGNKKEAARLLKLKRTTLLEKIKKKNLTSENW